MTSSEARDRRPSQMLASLLAELTRLRGAVAVAALLAIGVALLLSHRIGFPPSLESRSHMVGVASTLVLVDTPRSQVVHLGPSTRKAIAVLSARARLLATLMVSSPMSDQIARSAGLEPGKLIAMRPSTLHDRRRRLPPPRIASLSKDDPGAHVLHVALNPLAEGEHPLIAIDTQAPDAAAAGRLASRAIAVLEARLDAEARAGSVPADRRLVIRRLDSPEVANVRVGPSSTLLAVVALVVFVAGCAVVILVSRLRLRLARPKDGRGFAPPRLFAACARWLS